MAIRGRRTLEKTHQRYAYWTREKGVGEGRELEGKKAEGVSEGNDQHGWGINYIEQIVTE